MTLRPVAPLAPLAQAPSESIRDPARALALSRIAVELGRAGGDTGALMTRALQCVADGLEIDGVAFVRVDAASSQASSSTDATWLVATRADDPAVISALAVVRSETPALVRALARGRRGELRSASELDDEDARIALRAAGAAALLALRVEAAGDLAGVLACVSMAPREWSTAELECLRLLADVVAGAARRERMEGSIVDISRFLKGVVEFSRGAVLESDAEHEMLRPLAWAAEVLDFDGAFVMRCEPERSLFTPAVEYTRPGAAPLPDLPSVMASTAWGRSRIAEGRPFAVARPFADEPLSVRTFFEQYQILHYTSTPLRAGGAVLGCLALYAHHPVAPDGEWTALKLQLVADLCTPALCRQVHSAALRDAEWRLQYLLRSLPDPVALLALDGTVTEWTPRAETRFSLPRAAVYGRRLCDAIFEGNDRVLFEQACRQLSEEKQEARLDLTARSASGGDVPIAVCLVWLPPPKGPGIVASLRDVGERRRPRPRGEVTPLLKTAESASGVQTETTAAVQVIGVSQALRDVLQAVDAVASTEATVLIRGESGVGKDVIARAVHARSGRAAAPLVHVNCASIPTSLFESEFFGHVRGSFTGAHRDRVGRFELADGGTIFLDEVGEIPPEFQAKLLRILQDGEFERVGDDHTRTVDVRVIAATNRDLRADVESGRFRRDLYYRLCVVPIHVPPLRDRPEDVVPLAAHFLALYAKRRGSQELRFEPRQLEALRAYDWPGNVRELQHVVERAVILSRGAPLHLDLDATWTAAASSTPAGATSTGAVLTDDEVRKLERNNLIAALERSHGRIAGKGGAADLLGLRPSTLRDRMKAYGIQR